MQLNEIHNPHEHASVSLKVILLVFAVILVGVLGYLVWDSQKRSEVADNSAQTTTKNNAISVYTDADSTFSFELPEGYFVTEHSWIPTSSGRVINLSLVEKTSSGRVFSVSPVKIKRSQQGAPEKQPTLDQALDSAIELLAILEPDLSKSTSLTNPNEVKMKSIEGSVFGGTAYATVATDPQNHFLIYIDRVSSETTELEKYTKLYEEIIKSFKLI